MSNYGHIFILQNKYVLISFSISSLLSKRGLIFFLFTNSINYTIVLPKELKDKMDEITEINWSEVIRTSIKQKINDLTFLKQFTLNSDFSEEDVIKLGKEVNELLYKKYKGN